MKANKITKEQGYIEVRTVENHTATNKQKPIRTKIPQITLETWELLKQKIDPNSKDFDPYLPFQNPEKARATGKTLHQPK